MILNEKWLNLIVPLACLFLYPATGGALDEIAWQGPLSRFAGENFGRFRLGDAILRGNLRELGFSLSVNVG